MLTPSAICAVFGKGNAPAAELSTIDRGRLFLVRPDSIKGSRECLSVLANSLTSEPVLTVLPARSFIDASLSIRRGSDANGILYELVVTRAFQEGEEQILEEDAESEPRVHTQSACRPAQC